MVRSQATEKLPIPSPLVARVIELASDPDVETAKLAALLVHDPVLSARLIGIANSSFHAPRSPIATVDRAVNFLGLRAVRNVVLCIGVTKLFAPSELRGFPLDRFWECSLRRAAAARCLAKRLRGTNPDELFATGLCQDIGVLRLARQAAGDAAPGAFAIEKPSEERWLAERAAGQGHDQLSFGLLARWSFPEELALIAQYHHTPEEAPPTLVVRARICHAAEALADLFVVPEKHEAMRAAERAISKLKLGSEELPALCAEVNAAVTEASLLLDLRVGRQPTYEEIAARACEGLFELNLSYEELTRRLRETIVEKERLAEELKRLNRELETRALTDALTGLANRRAGDATLVRELAQSHRSQKPVSVLMADIDHFKRVNDTFGHATGDEVLRLVARAILTSIRVTDTAARYGGEEFVVILPGTPRENAQVVAERIRHAVAAAVHDGPKPIAVTVSLGGVSVVATRDALPDQVVARADKALYEAKSSGRDRVVWAP